jgi:hypothetical protein
MVDLLCRPKHVLGGLEMRRIVKSRTFEVWLEIMPARTNVVVDSADKECAQDGGINIRRRDIIVRTPSDRSSMSVAETHLCYEDSGQTLEPQCRSMLNVTVR